MDSLALILGSVAAIVAVDPNIDPPWHTGASSDEEGDTRQTCVQEVLYTNHYHWNNRLVCVILLILLIFFQESLCQHEVLMDNISKMMKNLESKSSLSHT